MVVAYTGNPSTWRISAMFILRLWFIVRVGNIQSCLFDIIFLILYFCPYFCILCQFKKHQLADFKVLLVP